MRHRPPGTNPTEPASAADSADGSPPREAARRRTEERLLEGAMRAVARHGLAKLSMRDVSRYAGVSRATAYRYFPDTEAVLRALGRREAQRFEQQVWEALEKAPPGRERLAVVLDFVDRLAREHPLIQRLPETDPGLVLTSLRERFPEIRAAIARLLGPALAETELVRSGALDAERLAGWAARVLISLFLFPEPPSRRAPEDLAALFELLARGPFAGLFEELDGPDAHTEDPT